MEINLTAPKTLGAVALGCIWCSDQINICPGIFINMKTCIFHNCLSSTRPQEAWTVSQRAQGTRHNSQVHMAALILMLLINIRLMGLIDAGP